MFEMGPLRKTFTYFCEGSNCMGKRASPYEGSGAALNQGGRNENFSNNLLDPSGHLRTFVARCGSQLAPRRWNDQSIEFGSAITGYDRRVSNLGVRFCHGRTAAVVGEPSLRPSRLHGSLV